MPIELTRKELFDLVWAGPMTKVASDLGISEFALRKTCDQHRIPVPGRGYWARLTAGRPTTKSLFREVSDINLNRVRIQSGPLISLPVEVQVARAKTHQATTSTCLSNPVAEPTNVPPDYQFHPLVQPTFDKLSKAKYKPGEFVTVTGSRHFFVTCSSTLADRVGQILNRLVTQSQTLGYVFEKSGTGMLLVVESEKITIGLGEKRDRIPHRKTEKEIAALEKWQTKYNRKKEAWDWISDWDKPEVPDWEYPPNGRLMIELDQGQFHSDGLRRKFSDGKRQRLENLIGGILVSAASISAERKDHAERLRLQKLEWQEQDRQRKEAERVKTLETKRWECLELQMLRHEKACRVESFVDTFKKINKGKQLPQDCQKFIRWAESTSHRLREEGSPEAISLTLERYNLMDDTAEISAWTDIK